MIECMAIGIPALFPADVSCSQDKKHGNPNEMAATTKPSRELQSLLSVKTLLSNPECVTRGGFLPDSELGEDRPPSLM